jgi:hypothetical protein
MATYNKFNCFVDDLSKGLHNFTTGGAQTFKVALSNTAPAATNTVLANITQISTSTGYTAGGSSTTQTLSLGSSVANVEKLVGTNVVFTSSAGSYGPLRYAVFYNSTTSSSPLISWWDYGSSITLNTGETFTVSFDATNGIWQLS